MKRILFLYSLVIVCVSAAPLSAQTVTSPSTQVNVTAANDFATRAFQDPWDMSQRTDTGWQYDVTLLAPAGGGWTNPVYSGGHFLGTTATDSKLFLLDSSLSGESIPTGGTASPVPTGKNGLTHPIDASTYTHLVYRMSASRGFCGANVTDDISQYIWSRTNVYEGQTVAFDPGTNCGTPTSVVAGFAIYDVDLASLSHTPISGTDVAWSGSIGALQIIPSKHTGTSIDIDWVRLVHYDASLYKTITWSGGGAVDLYLDNDRDPSNGTLGRIAVNKTGGTFSFFIGALPAGDYYIAVAPFSNSGTTPSASSYSTGFFRVNDIPTLNFTTPSDEGSSDDFATTQLGQAWDFTSMACCIDSTLPGFSGKVNITSDAITQLSLTNEAGTALGNETGYLGTSAPAASGNVGDPQIYPLFWDGKGKTTKIDPSRYRILTLDVSLPNMNRDLAAGSIGRVIWRAAAEPVLDGTGTKVREVSEQFPINSAAGENTLAHITMDMSKVPPVQGDLNTTWTSATAISGGLDAFRWDPHEFSPATNFFVKRIKLAALERTQNGTFTFKWNANKAGTVTVYYDTDLNDTSFSLTTSTVICGPVSVSAGAGSCTASSGFGSFSQKTELKVWAKIDDGTNQNFSYAPTNLVVDPGHTGAQIVLNRTSLNYTTYGQTRTSAQTVRLTFSGSGSQCWTATPNAQGLLTITPSSGTGAAAVSIAVTGNFPGGLTTVFVKFASCSDTSDTATVAVNVTGVTTVAGPSGSFDTPTDGATVTGSIATTGWAIDDVEVTGVTICRDAVSGESAPPNGGCGGQTKIFIGNAVFIDDARPDILASNPTAPFNYRTGWGYLLLTNFLPNQGNGTFTLYAYASDRDGHTSLLGTKTISAQNASASKPFGAIDTPGQGEVVCGSSYINFGWALTQNPNDIPADSSTITVYIDGTPVGHPGTRSARADITTLFSSNYVTDHAVGGFVFDTNQYANGVHSIYWLVTDTAGHQDGIGSRFFTVSNPCAP
jgi:hypothetical protein